jgi:hypothetical protein
MPPQPTGVGKSVQQDDRASLPGDLVLDTHTADVDRSHLASFVWL